MNTSPPPDSGEGRINVREVSHFALSGEQLWGRNLDVPRQGPQSAGDVLEIAGWVLGRQSPACGVEVVSEGRVLRHAAIDVRRPDVAAHFREAVNGERSGFHMQVGVRGIGDSDLLVQAVLQDDSRVPMAIIRVQQRWLKDADRGAAPLVSVVIPCYNLGAYLDEAVESVLAQSYDEVEILIVDDGSTDPATRHLFASYQRPRTRILRTKNQGLAAARNLGIREARGRYVSCLDAADVFKPTFLQRTVEALESDRSAAFASCWLTAFGESEFSWNPSTCDFPHLLAEDTVCTAALIRREALLDLGGFDIRMPIPGYADWDLAISLVERGWCGVIIPEYLFRYRIRPGSMSASWTTPHNHAVLMQYLVRKHADSYRQQLPGVLETIEKRTAELERHRSHARPPENTAESKRAALLEHTLRAVLESRNPTPSRPLHPGPRITVVIACCDQGTELAETLESVRCQTSPEDELILVDDGSTDLFTLRMLDWYSDTGCQVLRTKGIGATGARAAGLERARAPIVFALGADQTIAPTYIPRALQTLAINLDSAFVSCGIHDEGTGFAWLPDTTELPGILACPRVAFPVVRRAALSKVGGYDTAFMHPEQADWDLVIRLAVQGQKGTMLAEPLLTRHVRRRQEEASSTGQNQAPYPTVRDVIAKHAGTIAGYWTETIVGHEMQRRRLQAVLEPPKLQSPSASPLAPVEWGGLRRLEPVSRLWGVDRGQPIDRYYIARFLEQHRQDIRGRVLEVKDPGYTQAYGQGVEASDIVDIARDNPAATLVRDLAVKDSLPENTYDCFILTQTIHVIYDTRRVLENAARTLRPGGVVLATLPCVSRVDYESGLLGDFWRFTPAAVMRLFQEAFGDGQVEVQSFGNVLVCCAFLMGLASGELTSAELDHSDPYFPLLVCVRAVKARQALAAPNQIAPAHRRTTEGRHSMIVPALRPGQRAPKGGPKSLILMYHRVEKAVRDRWYLCVSPENFSAHLRCLKESFSPVSLADLTQRLVAGEVQHGAVALTFDDGYLDNLTGALPILKSMQVPATFFIAGPGTAAENSFWWEVLDAACTTLGLPDPATRQLHARLMVANAAERQQVLAWLPCPGTPLPPRLNAGELLELSRDPLVEIGAHGWSHRAMGALSMQEQRYEIRESVAILAAVTGTAPRFFAYPFGGPFTADTVRLLRETGIQAACTVADAPVMVGCDPMGLPRMQVQDWDGEEFKARIRAVVND